MIRRTYGGVPPWVPFSGPAYGYRNRVQLHRADGGLGYRGRGSSAVVRITSCPIAAEEVNALISAGGPIPRDRFTVVGVHGQVAVEGRDREFSVRIGARQFRAPTSSFFQSNFAMLPALAEWVQERLAGDSLLDLYCGVGLWTQLGAERGMRVTGVDSDAAAVRSARGNVQWPGTCFVCAAVERWVGDVACPVSFHSIVVDPPRTGLPKRVRRWLSASGARRIIYVSCNPSTMARDLTDLAPRDGVYRVVETGFFDFYPQTGHVEMAVLLERGVSGPPSS
jgi:tRNA/tmRNA/rRNA uracil-C5-methylase (TrmA/RlmC/RlmD family)